MHVIGSGGSFHPPVSESYHSGIRQHYGAHGPFQPGHRSHLDQRFGMSNQMPQEIHQGNNSTKTNVVQFSHVIPFDVSVIVFEL